MISEIDAGLQGHGVAYVLKKVFITFAPGTKKNQVLRCPGYAPDSLGNELDAFLRSES